MGLAIVMKSVQITETVRYGRSGYALYKAHRLTLFCGHEVIRRGSSPPKRAKCDVCHAPPPEGSKEKADE